MRSLPDSVLRRVHKRLKRLEDDPFHGASKLSVVPGYRARVGDYRILYDVNEVEETVLVTAVRHRREAYR